MSIVRSAGAFVVLILACMLLVVATSESADAATKYQRKAVVERAHDFLGTPYGSGPKRMTCTELTALSWRRVNVYLPYTLVGQRRASWTVGSWRRGDLVFYDSYLNGTMDHVALYVGNGYVIDANAYHGRVLKHRVHDIPGYIVHKRVT